MTRAARRAGHLAPAAIPGPWASLNVTSNDSIAKIARHVSLSRRAVAFTGAGISTESGIPDFRSPGGIWSRYRQVTFQEFLRSAEARRQYWLRRKEAYPAVRDAKPNAGHRVLASLESAGKLRAVITQNIDGLHQQAGSRRVLELHGNTHSIACLECGARYEPGPIQRRLEAGEENLLCGQCGGLLKPATISFGQPLPQEVLTEALQLCLESDLVLAIGSSLAVEPAASLPLRARRNGARLVIINRSETPLDSIADVVTRDSVGACLTALLTHLGLPA